ncbi:hypothetical protein F2Q70_00001554 [Brassica cretica]|uniref:Uncharacterized protein n=1 Tax=Brassica cretica TaxID=69181 RepID=A0A8S9IT82_BRACR|nr:hypothetical protein F2Q70_00001554 [Brassica cretica]
MVSQRVRPRCLSRCLWAYSSTSRDAETRWYDPGVRVQFIPALMWGGNSSIGSGEAKLNSKPLDISSALFRGLIGEAFWWSFCLRLLCGDNFRECRGFRVREVVVRIHNGSFSWPRRLSSALVFCFLHLVKIRSGEVVQFLGLKRTGFSGFFGKELWSLSSIACSL